MSCEDIRSKYKTYMGASLFIADIPMEWSEKELKNLVFTCKQVNTIPEKTMPMYNIVLIGNLEQKSLLTTVLSELYDHVSVCYWHTQHPITKNKTVGFSEALGSVVVGHYSINGSLLNEHFNLQGGRQTNLFNADKDDKSANEAGQVPRSIYEAVIRSLSFEGNCIIDATAETGNCAVAALTSKRDVVVIKKDLMQVRADLMDTLTCSIHLQ